MKKLAEFVREVRAIAVENGRAASDVNFFPMIAPIVGRTMEEAQAKHDRYEKNADWEGGLATISSFMNVDFSKYPVDEPFDVEGLKTRDSAIHSLINSAKNFAETGGKPLTPRMLGHAFAFCGFGQPYVGTPEMIADVFESFVNEADIDGFNVACEFSPLSPLPIKEAEGNRCLQPRVLRRSRRVIDPCSYGKRHHVERLRCSRRNLQREFEGGEGR
jgi:alkanesulfonate monooxygenase SsuD/methylene tetrahydromethanopterin reductase-like flavin-dependent oxidoreductase (luciferase family)